jgi:iron complex transport system substrate-binding protein
MWREVKHAQPDVIILMPYGYSIDRTLNGLRQSRSAQETWPRASEQRPNLQVVDAASLFSRPGSQLVDGVEILDSILPPHPDHGIDPVNALTPEAWILGEGSAS